MPVGVLARLADSALAVHGQNDQLRLLRPASSGRCSTGSPATPSPGRSGTTGPCAPSGSAVAAELVERRDGARRLAQEADLLRHGLTEIEAVDPQPGEDRELTRRPAGWPPPTTCARPAGTARAAIAGGDAMDARTAPRPSARSPSSARPAIAWAVSGDAALAALDSGLGDALAQLDDVAGELTGYLDRLDADPERLARVLGRQAELKALTRKYAADTDGVLAWAEQARERLEHLDTSDDALAALAARRDALAAELAGHAAAVTAPAPRRRRGWPTAPPPSWAGWRCPMPGCWSTVTPRAGRARRRRRPAGRRCARRRGRTASTRSSCGSSPTRARRRSRCTRARPAVSCRGSCWRWRSRWPARTRCRRWSSTRSTPASAAGRRWRSAAGWPGWRPGTRWWS